MTNKDTTEDAKRIGRRISDLLIEKDKTQKDLAEAIGVSKATVSSWTNGTRIPRMDKIKAMTDYFGCTRSDILGDFVIERTPRDEDIQRNMMAVLEAYAKKYQGGAPEFYDDEVVRIIAEKLRTNPEYAVLFKAAAGLKPEDVDFVTQFIEKMS